MARGRVRFSFLPIALSGGVIPYTIVLFAALVLSQTVRSSYSAVIMAFVLLVGAVDLIMLTVSVFFVKVYYVAESTRVQRGRSEAVRLVARNEGPIPIPIAELLISHPKKSRDGSTRTSRSLTLLPYSRREMTVRATFNRRGVISVGTEYVFVYDMLRLVRIRKKVDGMGTVTVLPADAHSAFTVGVAEGDGEGTSNTFEISVSGEYGDVREYRPGDSMKQVHWKLSSKGEGLVAKRLAPPTRKTVAVVCDIPLKEEYFPRREQYCEALDRVLELTLAAVRDAVTDSIVTVYLGDGKSVTVTEPSELDALAVALARVGYSDLPFDGAIPLGAAETLYVTPFLTERCLRIKERALELPRSRSSVVLMSLEGLASKRRLSSYSQGLDSLTADINGICPCTVVSLEGGDHRE